MCTIEPSRRYWLAHSLESYKNSVAYRPFDSSNQYTIQRRRRRAANAREQTCAFDHECAHPKKAKSSPRASVALDCYKSTSKKKHERPSAMSEPQKKLLCSELKMRGVGSFVSVTVLSFFLKYWPPALVKRLQRGWDFTIHLREIILRRAGNRKKKTRKNGRMKIEDIEGCVQ